MNAEPLGRRLIEAILGRMRVGSVTIVEKGLAPHLRPRRAERDRGDPLAARVGRGAARQPRPRDDPTRTALWDSPEPADVIRICALNIEPFDRIAAPLRAVASAAPGGWPASGAATRAAAPRAAIAAHYDRGNELFELMLDPTMTYSCGFFESPDASLEEASTAKLDRVCRKLAPRARTTTARDRHRLGQLRRCTRPREYGCRVTTTTLSRQQYDYAREQIARLGLGERVTLLLEDYRDLRGRYDKLVSIEMIEAVGWRDFGTFFERCSALLEPDGTMLLQAIAIDDRAYDGREDLAPASSAR